MKKIIFIVFIFISQYLVSQTVKCDELISYVESNGSNFQSVSSISLINSSWLNEVEAYKIKERIIVIAEIKKDDIGLLTKKYIFCGISQTNWDYFYYGTYDFGKTYGERFQKYIFNSQCNCN